MHLRKSPQQVRIVLRSSDPAGGEPDEIATGVPLRSHRISALRILREKCGINSIREDRTFAPRYGTRFDAARGNGAATAVVWIDCPSVSL